MFTYINIIQDYVVSDRLHEPARDIAGIVSGHDAALREADGVAKGIAGLGALFYVAAKVWQAIARAEPIDVYPLLRPFAIGLCILFFPTFVIGTINAVLSPVVKGCHGMLESQTFDMNRYREQKETLEREAFRRDPEKAYLASKEDFDKKLDELGWSPKDLKTMAVMYMTGRSTT